MLNIQKLKLPSLSPNLISKIHEFISYRPEFYDDTLNGENYHLNFNQKDYSAFKSLSKTKTFSGFQFFKLSKDLQISISNEMVDSLFPFHAQEIYLQVIYPGGELISPHIDHWRNSHLLYKITNEEATTLFFDEETKDEDRKVYDLSELSEPVEVHKLQPNNWYIFNSKKIHSVTNIDKSKIRVSIVINQQQDYQSFCKQYSNLIVCS
jgi:hypothetical protein